MKSQALTKALDKEVVKVEPITKFAPIPAQVKKSALSFSKDFRAGVIIDKKGSPRYFVFDTYSLWDLLCAVDTKLEENAPAKEYVFNNPVGWLIDAIESHLPINPKLAARLKKGIEDAKKLGLVPFAKIKRELGLS